MRLQLQTNIKKYKDMDGYVANTYTPYSFLAHVSKRFNISMYEIKQAHLKGKITLVEVLERKEVQSWPSM